MINAILAQLETLPPVESAITILTAIAATWILYQQFFSPLAHVPGPFFASLSRVWVAWTAAKGDTLAKYLRLHEKYGPVVRIASDEVLINDTAAARRIYSAGSGFAKSEMYAPFTGGSAVELFAEQDEKIHGAARRNAARAYAMDTMKDLEGFVDTTIEELCKHVDELGPKGFDFARWAQFFAFDVIGQVTFSKQFGYLHRGSDDGSLKKVLDASRSSYWLGNIFWLYRIIKLLKPLGVGRFFRTFDRQGSIRAFVVRQVQERQKQGTHGHKDMLSKLFEIHEEQPEKLSLDSLRSVAGANVNAGSDTTAITIRAVMYYLLKNPTCKRRLIDELVAARKSGVISADNPHFNDAFKLPYLQAVMYEALRLHAPASMSFPRRVPKAGIEVAGVFIPPGMIVGAHPGVVQLDKNVFGADANKFNPDRWLGERAADMHRSFLAFGQGSRTCLGKNLAWMEVTKLIPTLFQRYDIELVHPERDWTIVDNFFAIQEDLDMRMTRRVTPLA